jgi:hypothetical protein
MSIMNKFVEGLVSAAPAEEYADKLALYGQFIGDWTTETLAYRPDGSVERSEWDISFAWILEGRAIQDLWITPRSRDQGISWHTKNNRYSTTLRIYDPSLDAWHILWINPPSGTILRQIARKVGNTIVQTSPPEVNGDLKRWVYRDITKLTFRWFNEQSTDGGDSWQVVQEMRARRVCNEKAVATDERNE